MVIKYFSWIREHIGVSEQEIRLPSNVTNVNELVEHLIKINKSYQKAFIEKDLIKIAVNKTYASYNTKILDVDEIAFFPPVTGG